MKQDPSIEQLINAVLVNLRSDDDKILVQQYFTNRKALSPEYRTKAAGIITKELSKYPELLAAGASQKRMSEQIEKIVAENDKKINNSAHVPKLSVLSYEKCSFDDIIKAFYERNGPLLDEIGKWTVEMLKVADSKFSGWVKARLPAETIENIILPWHKHYEATLVPREGSTVKAAAEAWLNLPDYADQNPACAATMAYVLKSSFKKVILTQNQLKHDVFSYIRARPGHLYHLDGLHTLIAAALKKDFNIDFFIAVNGDFENKIR